MKAYKLFRERVNGSLGSLFINRRAVLPVGEWLRAEEHATKGFAFRPGWHCCKRENAPHLSTKSRIWRRVEIEDFELVQRPENQGGLWYLAKRMRILA